MSDPSVQHTSTPRVTHGPSETSSATATMRVLAAHDPREEVWGTDTLAEFFRTEEQKAQEQRKIRRDRRKSKGYAPSGPTS